MQISGIQPYNGPYCPHCGESIENADRMPQLSGNHCAGIGTSVLAQKTARIAELEKALRDLLDADRGFLGDDNQCVYCETDQRQGNHAETCVITQAKRALMVKSS